MNYYVYISRKGGHYVAEVPALPGCRTIGWSEEEVIDNIKSIIKGYLKNLRNRQLPVPRVKVVRIEEDSNLPESSVR